MSTQIVDIKTSIVKDEKGLNVFVDKELELRTKLSEIKVVDKENYEDTKKLKQEIISSKTGVDKIKKIIKSPISELLTAVETRAKELQAPFADMQLEIQAKLDVYEAEEKKKKDAESQRMQNIVDGIEKSESVADLLEFHKSLEPNDQKRKAVMEAFTLKKDKIIESQNKAEVEEFMRIVKDSETLNGLDEIKKSFEISKYATNHDIHEAIETKKSQLNLKIEQDKLEKDKAEAAEEKKKMLQEKIGIIIDKIQLAKDVSSLETLVISEELLENEDVQIEFSGRKRVLESEAKTKKIADFKKLVDENKIKINESESVEALSNLMNSFIENDELHNELHETYQNRLSQLTKDDTPIDTPKVEETVVTDEPIKTEETLSTGQMIKKWINDNHFLIEKDKMEYPVVNTLDLETYIDSLGL